MTAARGTIFGSVAVLVVSTILAIVLCAGAGLSLCSNRVDMGTMASMAGMDMPNASAPMGVGHVLICPIVLTLVLLLAAVAAGTILFVARDRQRAVTRRHALRRLASLPVIPIAAVLGIVATLCVALMSAHDGGMLPSVFTCAGSVFGIFVLALAATFGAASIARVAAAIGVRFFIALVALCTRVQRDASRSFAAFRPTLSVLAAVLLLGSHAGLRAPPAVVR